MTTSDNRKLIAVRVGTTDNGLHSAEVIYTDGAYSVSNCETIWEAWGCVMEQDKKGGVTNEQI